MATYNRDFYFSEKQKQEIIRLCVNTPKLSINYLENFCREAKEEIQAWRKKPEFSMNDRENKFEDRSRSYGHASENKPHQFSSEDEDELVPIFEPYIPRPPIGVRHAHLSPEGIEEIRLNFIEQVYYSTSFPIAYEDMASLIDHAGQPMLVEDLLSLFGYTSFATMVREMPEFYFLDIYLGKDNKLWYFNKQIPSKTKFFQSEEKPIPKKGIQISIAETAYLEPDMVYFLGRSVFVLVLEKCLQLGRDERDGWVSFTTFQEYLSKYQKADFKTAWKTLIPEIGQIKRVWNEIVSRDIMYDSDACALKLKDDPQKLIQKIRQEEKDANEFWEKIKVKADEFMAEQAKEEGATKDDSSDGGWGDGDDKWGENDTLDWSNATNKESVTDTVNEKTDETELKLQNDKSVNQEIETDDGFEEIKAENQELLGSNTADVALSEIQNEDSSASKDNSSPTVEEAPPVIKSKYFQRKNSRAFADGSESEEEDYRVENLPSRSQDVLPKLPTEQEKAKEEENLKNESSNLDGNNSDAHKEDIDDKIYNDVEAQDIESGQNVEAGVADAKDDHSEEKSLEILLDNVNVSETLPINKVTTDEDIVDVKDVNAETEEAKHVKEALKMEVDGSNEKNIKHSKVNQRKKPFSQAKPKVIKKATFIPRKTNTKVAVGSESDEEDVRMENKNPLIHSAKLPSDENFDDDFQEAKPKNEAAIPPVPERNKVPRKAFGLKPKNDRKPKYRLSYTENKQLSKDLDEMIRNLKLCDENEVKIKEGKKTKKHKPMMDFGFSEAEYTDDDVSELSPPPETILKKEDEVKKKEKIAVKPTSSTRPFKPDFRPKQFQARIPATIIRNKSPTKPDHKNAPAESKDKDLNDIESDGSNKGW